MHHARTIVAEELGNQLVSSGKLDQRALQRAIRIGREHGERIDVVLTKLGLLAEGDLVEALAAHLRLKAIDAAQMPLAVDSESKIGRRFLESHNIVPIREDDETVELAMADPLDDFAVQSVELISGKQVIRHVAALSLIDNTISKLYAAPDVGDQINAEIGQSSDEDIERLRDLASEAPIIRAVNLMISKAVELKASDIHIEPMAGLLRVRYRVDGVLREFEPVDADASAAVISRIKIMARLDIAERRLPQDGRIMLVVKGAPIDLRVSTVPTVDGESVVLRILDRTGVQLDFAGLGFSGPEFERFRRDLSEPNGIVLVTGPTGSGKTTTLYTALMQLNNDDRNLLTVEDPVEFQIDGVNQIQVKSDIGLDFASVLRAMLRHDPDIIMVGEIRDKETAEIAIQAALTGHLVLSTLHTNDAASSISRLTDMGVEGYLIASSLRGILAQRLVRRLCTHCRESYTVTEELAAEIDLSKIIGGRPWQFYRPVGCQACGETGYRGRISIYEYLPLTEEIQRLAVLKSEAREIGQQAVAEGMQTILQNGLIKAITGETSFEEVLRVTRNVY